MKKKPLHGQVFKGQQKCSMPDCQEVFKWHYLYWEPKNRAAIVVPEKNPDEEYLHKIDDNNARCYCSHCQRMNFFELDFKSLLTE